MKYTLSAESTKKLCRKSETMVFHTPDTRQHTVTPERGNKWGEPDDFTSLASGESPSRSTRRGNPSRHLCLPEWERWSRSVRAPTQIDCRHSIGEESVAHRDRQLQSSAQNLPPVFSWGLISTWVWGTYAKPEKKWPMRSNPERWLRLRVVGLPSDRVKNLVIQGALINQKAIASVMGKNQLRLKTAYVPPHKALKITKALKGWNCFQVI